MSLSPGQQQYLLELLSHEYTCTQDQQDALRKAICRYSTTVYSPQELDTLVTMPQSPAACLYYQGQGRNFFNQYGLWLNCLEYTIYWEQEGLEAILLNPDPTGTQKLFAMVRQQDDTLQALCLPPLSFQNGQSRWSLQEANQSLQLFLAYARQGGEAVQEETFDWTELYQQAQLFSMVKEGYTFAEFSQGLHKPSNWKQLQELYPTTQTKPSPHKNGKPRPYCPRPDSWMYQPPASPFAQEKRLLQQMKQSLSAVRPPMALTPPRLPIPALPIRPTMPPISSKLLPPPFSSPGRKKQFH